VQDHHSRCVIRHVGNAHQFNPPATPADIRLNKIAAADLDQVADPQRLDSCSPVFS